MIKRPSFRNVDMVHGSILKGMVRFALPLAASSILQLLFNAADVVVIGQFGSPVSLAAVGADGLIVGLFANLLLNLSIGSTVLAAKFLGACEDQKVRGIVNVSMILALTLGIFGMIITAVFGEAFLKLLGTPLDVMPGALEYLYFYLPGIPGVALYNFGAAILRAKGDTSRPFYFLIISGLINVILNLFFVIGFKMDVAGVALATTISQYVATGLMLRCLARERKSIRFDIHKIYFDSSAFKGVLKIGAPAAFQCLVFYISNFVIQASVNSFGPVTMAGNAAAANIEMFVWVCMSGFEIAGMTYISRNLGAKEYGRIDESNRISLFYTFCIGEMFGLIVVFFARSLMRIYSPDPAIIEQGVIRIYFVCGTYGICGLMDGFSSNLRGLGHSVLPSVVCMFGACGLRLLWIFTFFNIPVNHKLTNLYVAYPGSWSISAIVLAVCYVVVRRKYPKG